MEIPESPFTLGTHSSGVSLIEQSSPQKKPPDGITGWTNDKTSILTDYKEQKSPQKCESPTFHARKGFNNRNHIKQHKYVSYAGTTIKVKNYPFNTIDGSFEFTLPNKENRANKRPSTVDANKKIVVPLNKTINILSQVGNSKDLYAETYNPDIKPFKNRPVSRAQSTQKAREAREAKLKQLETSYGFNMNKQTQKQGDKPVFHTITLAAYNLEPKFKPKHFTTVQMIKKRKKKQTYTGPPPKVLNDPNKTIDSAISTGFQAKGSLDVDTFMTQFRPRTNSLPTRESIVLEEKPKKQGTVYNARRYFQCFNGNYPRKTYFGLSVLTDTHPVTQNVVLNEKENRILQSLQGKPIYTPPSRAVKGYLKKLSYSNDTSVINMDSLIKVHSPRIVIKGMTRLNSEKSFEKIPDHPLEPMEEKDQFPGEFVPHQDSYFLDPPGKSYGGDISDPRNQTTELSSRLHLQRIKKARSPRIGPWEGTLNTTIHH